MEPNAPGLIIPAVCSRQAFERNSESGAVAVDVWIIVGLEIGQLSSTADTAGVDNSSGRTGVAGTLDGNNWNRIETKKNHRPQN